MTSSPVSRSVRPPYRLALTALHLAALGMVGFTVTLLLLTMIGTGIGMLIIGIGLILLVALVYALFGIAWFETARVGGLYRIPVIAPTWQPLRGHGFGAWFGSVLRQSIDGRMWRSFANFAISSAMGVAVLALVQGFVHALLSVFRTFSIWWQPGVVGMLLSAAAILGIVLLHRIVSIAIIGAGVTDEALVEQARVSQQQREGAVRAADVERTRIERDLHDGVQPRLVSVGMTLGLAQEKIESDPAAAKLLVAEAHTSTKAAITELRQLARGIYASVLDDRGLDAALSALAARSHIPVHLDVRLVERFSRDAEAAVYFAIAESLTNAAKHSRASEARVLVRVRADDPASPQLWARVEDNGIGGAQVTPGGGLDGIMNRVLAAGGTARLESPQGGPTALEVSVPCAS
ncbi:sensor histidine kinase [Leucobacter japonicus]|uniref:sensor histidine kinase n=1 Tax=Leucobacter japonicus TaxID=1461259 RepID=UPI0006A788EF|nr:histidine kinase [Leucobacter japonicus]